MFWCLLVLARAKCVRSLIKWPTLCSNVAIKQGISQRLLLPTSRERNEERVGQTLGKKEARGLMVSTFHTLGLNIIRREYKSLGLKAGFSLFDDQDQLALLKDLTEEQLDGDKDLLRQLLSSISNWKNEMLTADQVKAQARSEQEQLFAFCFEKYLNQMKAYNALDFDDLIAMPVLLLKTNSEVRERWQSKIRYLLVDEYQDTNTSQYELVRLIVGERAGCTVVGMMINLSILGVVLAHKI